VSLSLEAAADTGTAPGGFSRSALLFELLVGVVQRHEPRVAAVLRGERTTAGMSAALLARTLRAQGIWFQLLSIAEQNRDMRNRREAERERGYETLRGTFANVFASAAAEGMTGEAIRETLSRLRVRPVITAHPTEAKRVTVMEAQRRIYLRLLDLESPRWTDRERQELIDATGNEIELLWLTGELKLAQPTVAQEVAWGLYFFNENLFDVVPQVIARAESAFAARFGDVPFEVPSFIQMGSWIGGDRDGNPNVTSDVTRRALWETRLASLRRYRIRLLELIRKLSIEDHALTLPASFRRAVAEAIRAAPLGESIENRNRGEPFRQFMGCMLARIEVTIEHAERGQPVPGDAGYRNADRLLEDIDLMRNALTEAGAKRLSDALLRPLSREVSASTTRSLPSSDTSITVPMHRRPILRSGRSGCWQNSARRAPRLDTTTLFQRRQPRRWPPFVRLRACAMKSTVKPSVR
jgi:phosphoenolpyruvate carboxylase